MPMPITFKPHEMSCHNPRMSRYSDECPLVSLSDVAGLARISQQDLAFPLLEEGGLLKGVENRNDRGMTQTHLKWGQMKLIWATHLCVVTCVPCLQARALKQVSCQLRLSYHNPTSHTHKPIASEIILHGIGCI